MALRARADLDSGGATLCDGVRNSDAGRVDHGHEAEEPESRQRKVDRILRLELEL
jgi:hypothetical protein